MISNEFQEFCATLAGHIWARFRLAEAKTIYGIIRRFPAMEEGG